MLETNGFGSSCSHDSCQKELLELKQEVDRLKGEQRRTLNRAGTTPIPITTPSKVCDDEMNQLRVQVQLLQKELERCGEEHERSLRTVQDSWIKDRSTLKEELVQTERSYKSRIADLEQQSQRQRDRSLALLQEKDEELSSLRQLLKAKNAPVAPAAPSSTPSASSNNQQVV